MTAELAAWTAVAGAVVALIACAKFWMDVGATKRDAAEALEKAEANATNLANFKEVVAKEHPSHASLAASENRLAAAIDGMRSDWRSAIADLTNRIDRLLHHKAQD